VLKIDGINGAIDQGRVRGSISVSFAGAKPFIDAAIQSERIDLTALIDKISPASGPRPTPDRGRAAGSPAHKSSAPATAAIPPGAPGSAAVPDRGGQILSDAPLDFFGLRLVEGNLNLSARAVLIRNLRIAPAAIEATLLQDILTTKLSPSGVYGGQATGEFVVDLAESEPKVGMQVAFSEIDALPFLRDAFAFPYIAGRARGAIELKGAGSSQLQIVSSLDGRADILFENGAVRGLNLPNMVRSLLDMVLAGWQPKASDETRFSAFAATFAIENGIARSTDVKFTGPYMVMTAAGSADLRAQTVDFRADPRLVSSPVAPGGTTGAWGIGVPVVIQGPWSGPRIYADTPNILAEPDRALRALRDALGGGKGSGRTDSDAPLGKFIEGFSKQLGKTIGETGRDGGAIADKMLDALGANGGVAAPQPETTAPDAAQSSPQTATPRTAPTPAPDQDLERGAREFLRDLLGR
jgi:AsmA protein